MPPQVYHIVFYATAGVLVLGVAALEIYRLRTGRRGRVRSLSCGAGFGLGDASAEVEMEDGRVITASVPGCTQCVCRLRPGDAVVVSKVMDRFVVGAAVK